MDQTPVVNNPKPGTSRPDYYATNTGVRKTVDFILGALLTIVGGFLLNFPLGLGLLSQQSEVIMAVIIGTGIAILIVYLLVRFFNKTGRRYISIGILSTAIIPILVFGSCMYILNDL
ncbi:MAG: hypothetical protein PHZ00_00510 [Candidatus Peribacteraceae bacterium]|nr:hypothetical protein [Candidatus Peribacteraceae bacterium]